MAILDYSFLLITLISLCNIGIVRGAVIANPVLEPVSDEGWGDHLIRRSLPADYFTLAGSEHMVWNSAPDSTDNIFVNMTMATGEEELVISMERFAGELKEVKCDEDMIMSFKSNSSYMSAIESWDWVNFNENRTFIMIANYPGCGSTRSRQPWVVSNAAYDPAHLVVHLNATQKSWKEVAHTYKLDFGRFSPSTSSKGRRQVNVDKQVSIPVGFTLPVDLLGSYSPWKGLGIACKACGTQGHLLLDGHIVVDWFQLTEFTVTAKPVGIQADFNLALTYSGSDPTLQWQPEPWTLPEIPLPGGWEIPGILEFGDGLEFGLGIAVNGLKGSATASTTVKAIIPDSSIAQIRLAGNPGATFSGWYPQFAVTPLVIKGQVMSTLEVFGQAKIGLFFKLMGQGLDAGLVLKAPDVVVTAQHVQNDWCAGKKVADGVSWSVSLGANLGIQVQKHIEGQVVDLAKVPMVNISAKGSEPWFSSCFPI